MLTFEGTRGSAPPSREYVDALRLRHRPLTPKPFQSLVHGDARKPCRKTGLGSEALQMRKSLDVSFLHGVFGFAVTPQDASRNAVKPPVVTLDDSANRSRVASKRLSHQRLIVQGARNFGLLVHSHRASSLRMGCFSMERVPWIPSFRPSCVKICFSGNCT